MAHVLPESANAEEAMTRSRRSNVPAEKTAAADAASAPDFEQIRREIELRAYYRYCERGYIPGADVEDWLAAEHEVLARTSGNGADNS